MKKNIFFISLIALVVIIIAAVLLYNNLSSKVDTPSVIEDPTTVQSNEVETESNNNKETKTNPTQPENQETSTQSADTEEEEEFPAPDFELLDNAGNTVNFSDYTGKPTVVNFWASWCGPCVVEMPYFQSAYEKHSEDVNFMMVNLTSARETMENATEFIDNHDFTFPVFYDFEQQAASAYNISSIPLSVFIDTQGNIVTYARGWRRAGNKPALNSDLWKRMLELLEIHDATFEWIKGHSGHAENERCDDLAVQASQQYM